MKKSIKTFLSVLIFFAIVLLGTLFTTLTGLNISKISSFIVLAIAWYTAKWFYNRGEQITENEEPIDSE